jgi:hypothetical protein
MKTEVPEFRRQVGIILRLPIVLFLGILWVLYIWWWIAGFGIATTIILLVLHPIVYPILYVLIWIILAFDNSAEPVLPNYWKNYPDNYFEWCQRCLKLGFPTLRRWLLEGFDF